MRGTTSALRVIFGYDVGSEYDHEFILVDEEPVHLFDCFSFVNYMMCAAFRDDESNRGDSSTVMQQNCAHHFAAILERLRPTLLILQGKDIRRWIAKYRALAVPEDPPECLIERAQIGDTECLMLSFSHPSTWADNWGRNHATRYLTEVVVPTIRTALSRLGFSGL